MEHYVEGSSLDQCSNMYPSAEINRKQICAGGYRNIDLCSKDSGDLIDFQIEIRNQNKTDYNVSIFAIETNRWSIGG